DTAGSGQHFPEQQLDKRGHTFPAGPYNKYKLSLIDPDVNITQRHIPAGICFADINHFQHW
ncbi:MAG: hypothetical protein VZR04_04615, partial [Succiniclasticum sp.]|nr:hypothetical protein [Succiniclasticum sp.]